MNINKNLILEDLKLNNTKTLLSLLFLLVLSVVINFSARVYEKNVWLDNPSIFIVEDTPLVRSGDPALYLKIAQYIKRNESLNNFYDKVDYPIPSKKIMKILLKIYYLLF